MEMINYGVAMLKQMLFSTFFPVNLEHPSFPEGFLAFCIASNYSN